MSNQEIIDNNVTTAVTNVIAAMEELNSVLKGAVCMPAGRQADFIRMSNCLDAAKAYIEYAEGSVQQAKLANMGFGNFYNKA
jgi:hypothetical protein